MTTANNQEHGHLNSVTDEQTNSPARHTRGASKSTGALMWSFFVRLKWQYFALLLSHYGQEILTRKYDAIATDRAYENNPSGLLGPVGRTIDRMVLNFPLHEGLRQRLRIVVDNIKSDVSKRLLGGESKVRILSAPCGLSRDVLTAAAELRDEFPNLIQRVEIHALDLDITGEVLPIASERAKEAGVPVTFYRDDLFNSADLESALNRGERFDIVNCIGLTPWLTLDEIEQLAKFFHDKALTTNGTLIIDNFLRHEHSAIGDDLEIHTRYHDSKELMTILEKSGFSDIDARPTVNGVNTIYTARAA